MNTRKKYFPKAESVESVNTAIRKFNEELPYCPALIAKLNKFRVFYVLKSDEMILFGPSKFVGYKDMDAKTYQKHSQLSAKHEGLHGIHSEQYLSHLYNNIDMDGPEFNELYEHLIQLFDSVGNPLKEGRNRIIKFKVPK